VRVFFDRSSANDDALFGFESGLEDSLEPEIGFVDGNDISQSEFVVYCLGPRKWPLLKHVKRFCESEAPGRYKIK
jgi:hypothetical protein